MRTIRMDGVSVLSHPPTGSWVLHTLVVLTAITTGILAALGLVAVSRRRSAPYLLIAVALLFLLGKAVVALLALGGYLDFGLHNLIEHAIDFAVATLLIAAIIEARNPFGCSLRRWVGHRAE